MLGFLSALLGFADPIRKITEAIANERIAQAQALTDKARIDSQERIAALQSQRDVLIADAAHSKLDMYVRCAAALGPIAYSTKIFLWDKMLGWGSTDNISEQEWYLVMMVYGFYFVHSIADMWSRRK